MHSALFRVRLFGPQSAEAGAVYASRECQPCVPAVTLVNRAHFAAQHPRIHAGTQAGRQDHEYAGYTHPVRVRLLGTRICAGAGRAPVLPASLPCQRRPLAAGFGRCCTGQCTAASATACALRCVALLSRSMVPLPSVRVAFMLLDLECPCCQGKACTLVVAPTETACLTARVSV